MAEPHVVSGLVAKRAEMAGLIDHHKKQIARLTDDLAHLDATLKLFDPEIDLRTLRPKEHRERNRYFPNGQGQRMLLDALRTACEPQTIEEMSVALAARLGVSFEEPGEARKFEKTVQGLTNRAEASGLVKSCGRVGGRGRAERWQIA
jgi:hypothetical protein